MRAAGEPPRPGTSRRSGRQEPTGIAFFAAAAATFEDEAAARRQNRLVYAGAAVIGVLNLYPYNNGHLLVSPRRHVGQLRDLTDQEHLEAMQTLARFTELYAELIRAEGFNIGLNLNRPAARACRGICTGTSYRGGRATTISCR